MSVLDGLIFLDLARISIFRVVAQSCSFRSGIPSNIGRVSGSKYGCFSCLFSALRLLGQSHRFIGSLLRKLIQHLRNCGLGRLLLHLKRFHFHLFLDFLNHFLLPFISKHLPFLYFLLDVGNLHVFVLGRLFVFVIAFRRRIVGHYMSWQVSWLALYEKLGHSLLDAFEGGRFFGTSYELRALFSFRHKLL